MAVKMKDKKVIKELFKVIIHDLECLELKETEDNQYHYNLLIGNLEDLFKKLLKDSC